MKIKYNQKPGNFIPEHDKTPPVARSKPIGLRHSLVKMEVKSVLAYLGKKIAPGYSRREVVALFPGKKQHYLIVDWSWKNVANKMNYGKPD